MKISSILFCIIGTSIYQSFTYAFKLPISSRCNMRSQMSMEFDWKSFKKGTEERMGKSVDSKS